MDRLIELIDEKQNPSVVGLDPTEQVVPPQLMTAFTAEAQAELDSLAGSDVDPDAVAEATEVVATGNAAAYFEFNRAVIDAVADIVPAVKPQIAMYEALGPAGLDAYAMTCEYAQQRGLYVIGDIKRGDIGSTATAYAAHLTDDQWHEDAVTVNPYLGSDGIEPFLAAATDRDKDLFALVRTSNPSGSQVQELELAGGERVYEKIADLVEQWGAGSAGRYGYSRIGAVVGATHRDEGRALRARMPHTFFLVPGYGAQGGTAADVAGMFDRDGSGIVVNSSRGIIGAWTTSDHADELLGDDSSATVDDALDAVITSARLAAKAMRDDLRAVMP
ncbi:orotidine-5'-phosphate decarboxylase [Bifidobacterium choloepi]|uniref:Orotidine 5'-phosphate decarboxylase n=1 Tax=Bifidobacterium choloepi TaxID=2614131 RepID=A0A6I5NCF7_9BIFI|nr:orotidine-5'-phosphate decarboxylase [Bifidobacterium choloepi]NEG69164.1 orotidine-5'-phosphate decarboxylase [Bifidobacterium choloepi]